MDYFNKMDGAGGYIRSGLLGLSQGVNPLHDPLRLHPSTLHPQIPTEKDSSNLLRPLTDYPAIMFPFAAHHLIPPFDHRLPFQTPSAFHPLTSKMSSTSSNTTPSLSHTLSGSAFAPAPKIPKLQADQSSLFSHSNAFLSGLEHRGVYINGPSPPGHTEERRDSPSPRESHGSRESPNQARESSSPTSPGEDMRVRKRSGSDFCPVCCNTIRPGELESHVNQEIECFIKNEQNKKLSPYRCSTPTSSSSIMIPSSPHSPNIFHRSRCPGWDTFQRVKTNRQLRIRSKKRKIGRDEHCCPFCGDRFNSSTNEEIHHHMTECPRRGVSLFGLFHQSVMEDEEVDVEGETYEDLEWARRHRTAALLRAQQQLQARESENDISSEKEVTSATPEKGVGSCGTASPEVNSTKEDKAATEILEKELETMKERVKTLEQIGTAKSQCIICQNEYNKPAVSKICWHVLCESCWPHAMNSKKECPYPDCNETYVLDDIKAIRL